MAKIIDMFRLRKVANEVGIEIEIEGRGLPNLLQKYWNVERDGSLKAPGYEYVSKPLPIDEVSTALKHLWETFTANKARLKPSDQCGVHIHLNMQTWTFDQTMTFICLYLVMEDLFVRWCGEDREGNLFCLRGKDAEYIYEVLLAAQRAGTFRGLQGMGGDMRYSSINLNSLRKFGTLEFRALRTPKDYKIIEQWVKMLLQLRKASKDFSLPTAVVEGVSMEGAENFIKMVMGKYTQELVCPDMNVLLMNGVRHVQEIAYEERRKGDEEQEVQEEDEREMKRRGLGLPGARAMRYGALRVPEWAEGFVEPAPIPIPMPPPELRPAPRRKLARHQVVKRDLAGRRAALEAEVEGDF